MSEPFDIERDRGGDTRELSPDEIDALDESSENVLVGWPSQRVGEPDEPEERHTTSDPVAAEEPSVGAPLDRPAPPVEPADESETGPDESKLERESEYEPAGELAPAATTTAEHAPGELVVPPGYPVLEGIPEGRGRAVALVVSRFNGNVTTRLLESALAELESAGVGGDAITVMPVPGAFELPLAAMALAKTRRYACVVALGCVIRGDTPHFDYIASEAASGLQLAALETGVPVSFGVLTLDRADQAEHRIEKGAEAVQTALEMADVFAQLRAAAAR